MSQSSQFQKSTIIILLFAASLRAGWQYKQPISLSSTGTALTDYQILVTLTTSNFTYAHANADGSDIRFSTDGSGASAPDVDYWIESWNASGDSRIWIEVPSIPSSGGATVYLYYGNAGASSDASGDNTFLFFDDFPGSSVDGAKWAVHASGGTFTVTVSGGVLHQYSTGGYHILRSIANPELTNNIIIEHKMKIGTVADATNNNRNRFYVADFERGVFDNSSHTTVQYNWGGTNGYSGTATTLNTWLRNINKVHGSTLEWQVSIYSTGVSEYSNSGTVTYPTPVKYYPWIGDYNSSASGGDLYSDWVLVRQYAATEPAVSLGSESSAGDASLPVELSSFTARQDRSTAVLEWITESEIDNLGFILERRRPEAGDWTEIASYRINPELQGQGSTTSRTHYEYIDQTVTPNTTYEYRIADVSYDGVVEFHLMTTLSMTDENVLPVEFGLRPAYPNPFNPATTLRIALTESGNVSLII